MFVDGVLTVREIAWAARVGEALVALCVAHLAHFRLVVVIDQFHLSSRYRLTPRFAAAFADPAVAAAASNYLRGGVAPGHSSSSPARIPLRDIVLLYSSIQDLDNRGAVAATNTIGDIFKRHLAVFEYYGISLRHFTVFGQRHGFLRRVKE
eukprot:Selendium_serpulae@DN1454_c0_g1_i2.p3